MKAWMSNYMLRPTDLSAHNISINQIQLLRLNWWTYQIDLQIKTLITESYAPGV